MDFKKTLFLLACVLALPTFVFAQGTTTLPVSSGSMASSTQKVITLATVNIQNTNIVSEAGHSFVISFDFTNREGIQTGVKYGVRLVAERPDKTQYIADSKIYDETIVLPEQSTTHREITYTAPSVLAGTYSLYLESNNGNGLSLAVAFVGKINLAAGKGLEILSSSCFLTVAGEQGSPHYSLAQGVDIVSSETILLNCEAKNNTSEPRSAAPVFATHYRNAYGDIVAQTGGDTAPILFAAGENKSFSISLPKAASPQAYDVLVMLNTADGPSNTIDVHYVLRGTSATIQSLSLDKNQYRKGDIALLFLHWSGSADGFPNSRLGMSSPSAATIEVTLTGRGGSSCAAPVQEVVGAVKRSYNTDIRIPVTATCLDPHVVITLKDANGNVLAQKELVLTSPPNAQGAQTSSLLIAALLILLLVGIGGGIAFIRKRRSGASTLVVFLFVVAAGSMLPLDRAYADTYSLSNYVDWTINTNGTTFNPGGAINISVHGLGAECGNSGGGSLYVQIQGITPEYFIAEAYGGDVTNWEQPNVYGNITLTAPSPGSYNLLFRTSDSWGVFYLNVPITVVSPCAANTGAACSSAANACGQTQANGTIQCNGSCSSTPPGLPGGYGNACSSAPNACGQTRANGAIQCNGSCSSTPPANPSGYGSACTSAANACGQTQANGTYQCNGSCSSTPPPNSNCPTVTASLSASPTSVAYNGRSTLTWGSANATSCTAGGPWSNSGTLSGSGLTNPLTTNTTFTFQCTGPGGTSALQSVTVTVAAPTCANGANNYPTCNTCSNPLFWNGASCVSCTGGCTGGVCNSGANNPPSCNAFTPTATLSASPTTIDQGQSATLSWNSTNSTACTGTGFTAGGPSGSRSTGALNTPGTQNYQVVCTGAGGSSAPAFASVLVLSPAATISASPARVVSGSNTTLSWSANGVTSCVVTGPSGTLASGNANGSHDFSTGSPMSVAITGQSTFTITCQTNGDPVTNSVTANIIAGFREF